MLVLPISQTLFFNTNQKKKNKPTSLLNARLQALNSVHYNLKIILQREILVNVTQKRFKDPKFPLLISLKIIYRSHLRPTFILRPLLKSFLSAAFIRRLATATFRRLFTRNQITLNEIFELLKNVNTSSIPIAYNLTPNGFLLR